MEKKLKGAAVITSGLKEYGYGESMEQGIKRMQKEAEREGYRKCERKYQRMNLIERVFNRNIFS